MPGAQVPTVLGRQAGGREGEWQRGGRSMGAGEAREEGGARVPVREEERIWRMLGREGVCG